jgi:hypothetical protein
MYLTVSKNGNRIHFIFRNIAKILINFSCPIPLVSDVGQINETMRCTTLDEQQLILVKRSQLTWCSEFINFFKTALRLLTYQLVGTCNSDSRVSPVGCSHGRWTSSVHHEHTVNGRQVSNVHILSKHWTFLQTAKSSSCSCVRCQLRDSMGPARLFRCEQRLN